MVKLEVVSVIGLGVDNAVGSVLEPVGGAFHSVDKVRTFILWLELSRHIHLNHGLPN
jgi:hypothetical protein